MTPERWRQIQELYHSARERTPADRAALLSQADPELRSEVEAMLAQDTSGGKIPDVRAQDRLEVAEKPIRNDECAVGAVYFLRLRAAALALRGPPASR